MRDRIIHELKARLSLRPPQAEALTLLADIIALSPLKDVVPFTKAADPAEMLAAIRTRYPSVQDFERQFPSLCFSLATGVGKTRLMGAFITWLYQTNRSRHFFVLAPNTTIYSKLIADFSPNGEKYVFRGIAEFAQLRPLIITGDTWDKESMYIDGAKRDGRAVINIFNVDKINKVQGRIKKLHEYIGQSYFDYLAELPDLVLLMDEAHRYRAKAGWSAVADLQPVLGLELTATPRSTGAKSEPFKNIVYHYGLGEAMRDGFVKEPAVATRKDFRPDSVTPDQLERIKLEDGIHCHENVKTELTIYARQQNRPLIHPFMLVVAQDTSHAERLKQIIEADDFFAGRYRGRVIRVDSSTKGEESDDATARLLALERDTTTDIVIHVNKLKEGWDVRNLFTIVPLRAAASDILTEQTLGRGLRLPYGRRTGVEAVDTLTIIAHDRFNEVIEAARDPNSVIALKPIVVGANGDVSDKGAMVLESRSHASIALTGNGMAEAGTPFLFQSPEERAIADATLRILENGYERKCSGGIQQLLTPEIQSSLAEDVRTIIAPTQPRLDLGEAAPDIAKLVRLVTEKIVAETIAFPEILLMPNDEVNFGFHDFDLTGLSSIALQPLSDDIMIQKLRDESRTYLTRTNSVGQEVYLENYLVKHLIDYNEIDYNGQKILLFKLSGQIIEHLRTYLSDDASVEAVLITHGKDLARFIYEQMKRHMWETPVTYRVSVPRGFTMLRPQTFNVAHAGDIADFRTPVVPLSQTPKRVFGGFQRCCYPYQKFDSNPERAFAVLIDSKNEADVLRWMKPGPRQFPIFLKGSLRYEPDFVIETANAKLIVEIKARNEINDAVVQEKAQAALHWIGLANQHALENGGKPWRYALIPDDAIVPNATLDGLMARYHVT